MVVNLQIPTLAPHQLQSNITYARSKINIMEYLHLVVTTNLLWLTSAVYHDNGAWFMGYPYIFYDNASIILCGLHYILFPTVNNVR
jgi:hypothetical protein